MTGGTDDADRAHTLLVAGTASHVGKSTVVAGLCRLLADRGVSVAPFKAQNMSNNARAVRRPDGDWGEVGVSQYVQARAARVTPTTDHNPVLLKPRGDGESQLVLDGEAAGHVAAGHYYDEHWVRARETARAAHARLAARYDVIVAEGAGSIAETNLHHRDLANVETARSSDADVLVLGDIERGGVFASLYGTLELMPEDVRERVVGTCITKFRGDASLLESGVTDLEARTGVPVLGVLPYDDPGLPEEDSVSLPAEGETATFGDADGVDDARTVTVVVPRLGRVSNGTDLEPLAAVPGVRVAYRPPDAPLEGADAVVLPGTKNTVDDLLTLRAAGFGARLAAFDGPVVGLCGGYQMLGERLENAALEGTGETETVEGFGLLPVVTRFSPEKRVERTTVEVSGTGPIDGASGTATGYEIHAGRTELVGEVARPLGPESAARGDTLGTYLHGLFENRGVREAFVDGLYRRTGRERPALDGTTGDPYAAAAALCREAPGLLDYLETLS
jgi:adenosylcobyric acid synthase